MPSRYAPVVLCTSLVLLLGSAASAQSRPPVGAIWDELPDAGELLHTGQSPLGSGMLRQVRGELRGAALEFDPDWADAFRISITSPVDFLVSTVGGAAFDTQLFLFDAAGLAVATNDDVSPDIRQSAIGAVGPGRGTLVPSGDYLLIVAAAGYVPVSAGGDRIWVAGLGPATAPNGPAWDLPLGGWTAFDRGSMQAGHYTIEVRGAEISTLPAPSALVLGALGLVATSRRCRTR